jgi:hypothetical protein
MAAKSDDVAALLFDEVERSVRQVTDLSLAFTRAATRAWTQGVRATVDALDAATEEPAARKGDGRATRDHVERLGRGIREFTRKATIAYGDALRQGAAQYVQAVERSLGKSKPAKTRRAARKVAAKRGRARA